MPAAGHSRSEIWPSAVIRTKGRDANSVIHVHGEQASVLRLFCEQAIGGVLRRQSYELNDENVFDVEAADILGIPRDCSASETCGYGKPSRSRVQIALT